MRIKRRDVQIRSGRSKALTHFDGKVGGFIRKLKDSQRRRGREWMPRTKQRTLMVLLAACRSAAPARQRQRAIPCTQCSAVQQCCALQPDGWCSCMQQEGRGAGSGRSQGLSISYGDIKKKAAGLTGSGWRPCTGCDLYCGRNGGVTPAQTKTGLAAFNPSLRGMLRTIAVDREMLGARTTTSRF